MKIILKALFVRGRTVVEEVYKTWKVHLAGERRTVFHAVAEFARNPMHANLRECTGQVEHDLNCRLAAANYRHAANLARHDTVNNRVEMRAMYQAGRRDRIEHRRKVGSSPSCHNKIVAGEDFSGIGSHLKTRRPVTGGEQDDFGNGG